MLGFVFLDFGFVIRMLYVGFYSTEQNATELKKHSHQSYPADTPASPDCYAEGFLRDGEAYSSYECKGSLYGHAGTHFFLAEQPLLKLAISVGVCAEFSHTGNLLHSLQGHEVATLPWSGYKYARQMRVQQGRKGWKPLRRSSR